MFQSGAKYLLNNGPKSQGNRWRVVPNATQDSIREILTQRYPGIQFTKTPQEADYVIVPEGVTQPGRKVVRLNHELGKSERIIPYDQVHAHFSSPVVQRSSYWNSKAYASSRSSSRKRKKKRKKKNTKKRAYQYTDFDPATGKTRTVVLPSELEPVGRAAFLDPSFAKRLEEVDNIEIPASEYERVRQQAKADAAKLLPSVSKPKRVGWWDQKYSDDRDDTLQKQPAPWGLPETAEKAKIQDKVSRIEKLLKKVEQGKGPPLKDAAAKNFKPGPPFVEDEIMEAKEQVQPPNITEKLSADADFQRALKIYESLIPKMAGLSEQFSLEDGDVSGDVVNQSRILLELMENLDRMHKALEFLYNKVTSVLSFYYDQRRGTEYSTFVEWQNKERENVENQVTRIQSLSQVREKLPHIKDFEMYAENVTNDSQGTVLSATILKAEAMLRLAFQKVGEMNGNFRHKVAQQVDASSMGNSCKELGVFCSYYRDPNDLENKMLAGTSLLKTLWSLYNLSCQVIFETAQSVESLSRADYERICDHLESIGASGNDLYTYLISLGYKGQDQPDLSDTTVTNFCSKTHERVTEVLGFPELRDFSSGPMAQFLRNLLVKESLYDAFVNFLLAQNEKGQVDTRSNFFQVLQSAMNAEVSDLVERKKLYGGMYLVSACFLMANLCQSQTKFTVDRISRILREKKFGELSDTFVVDQAMDVKEKQEEQEELDELQMKV